MCSTNIGVVHRPFAALTESLVLGKTPELHDKACISAGSSGSKLSRWCDMPEDHGGLNLRACTAARVAAQPDSVMLEASLHQEQVSPENVAMQVPQGFGNFLTAMVISLCMSVETCWRRYHKKITVCYFASVFCLRALLRSSFACNLSDGLTAALEDFMSMMSFIIGLIYLHGGIDGMGLTNFAHYVLNSPQLHSRQPSWDGSPTSATSLPYPSSRKPAFFWLLMP